MNLLLVSILTGTAALCWWLTRYDTMVKGENRASDLCRRITRCGSTLLLVAAAFASPWILIGVIPLLAVVWAGCLSELFLSGLHRLTHPRDTRRFDPKRTEHDLDKLAMLVRNGWYEQAIELCKRLAQSGEASTLALETELFQIYSRMFAGERVRASTPLLEAQRLRGQANPAAAASRLELLLGKEPHNLQAVFLLIRIYAQDLTRLDKADALLRSLAQRPHMPPVFVEHVRHFIQVWCGVVPRQETATEGIESLIFSRGDCACPKLASALAST